MKYQIQSQLNLIRGENNITDYYNRKFLFKLYICISTLCIASIKAKLNMSSTMSIKRDHNQDTQQNVPILSLNTSQITEKFN